MNNTCPLAAGGIRLAEMAISLYEGKPLQRRFGAVEIRINGRRTTF
jgi:hypothetical protein